MFLAILCNFKTNGLNFIILFKNSNLFVSFYKDQLQQLRLSTYSIFKHAEFVSRHRQRNTRVSKVKCDEKRGWKNNTKGDSHYGLKNYFNFILFLLIMIIVTILNTSNRQRKIIGAQMFTSFSFK